MNFDLTIPRNRNILAVVVVVVAVIVILIALLSSGERSGQINITTDPDATVYMSYDRGVNFVEIGTGSLTFKTTQPGDIYLRAESEKGTSLTTGQIILGEETSKNITIEEKGSTPKKLYDGSVSDAYVLKNEVLGISSTTSTLTNFGKTEQIPYRAEFVGLPYIKHIIWDNPSNFMYATYTKGVGVFVNGKNRSYEYVGRNIIREGETIKNNETLDLTEISRHSKNTPVALYGEDGLYMSTNNGRTLRFLKEGDISTIPHLTTDNNYIYLSLSPFPGAYLDDGYGEGAEDGGDKDRLDGGESTVYIYDYDGNLVYTLKTAAVSTINSIFTAEDKDKLYITDNEGVSILDIKSDSEQRLNHGFAFISNALLLGDRVVISGDNGIWRYAPDTETFHLIHEMQEGIIAAKNTMVPSTNGFTYSTAIFQGVVTAENNSTYEIKY